MLFHLCLSAQAFVATPGLRPVWPTAPTRAPVITALARDELAANLRAAGVATLASVVLLSAPMAAHAKGGGHGGGGHGGGGHGGSYHSSRPTYHSTRARSRSSSSSSRRHRSSSSSSYSHGYGSSSYSASPPLPKLLYKDRATAREAGGGNFCPAKLPAPGEKVDVDNGEIFGTRTAVVVSNQPFGGDPARASSVFPDIDAGCTVTVQYPDGDTETLSAAEDAGSDAADAATAVLLVGGYAAAFWSDSQLASYSREDNELLLEELAEAAEDADARASWEAPPSGKYWGASEESDEGDQSIRCELKFHANGKVTGRGRDGVDGSYKIAAGRWGVLSGERKVTLAWREEYDEGFEATIEGTYDAKAGKVKASFTSSRGVSGRFTLKQQPSVFG